MVDLNPNNYYAAERYMPRQLIESISLIESTSNPATYFSRYDFAIERAAILAQMPGVKIAGRTAKEVLEMLLDERDERTIAFIKRCSLAHKFQKLIDYVEENEPNWSTAVDDYYRQMYEEWILYR